MPQGYGFIPAKTFDSCVSWILSYLIFPRSGQELFSGSIRFQVTKAFGKFTGF
jgi:hypothetical protein